MTKNLERICKIIDQDRINIVSCLQELIRIKSVAGEPAEGMPFGMEVDRALRYCLQLSEQYGLVTRNIDGFGGHCELAGTQDEGREGEIISALVHVDVVEAGEGWTHNPFNAEIDNDSIFGRGAIDDKAAAIASIFALKAIRESRVQIRNRLRVIFGTDEETNWIGIKKYFSVEEQPTMGFTPDAVFPVVNKEKGIIDFALHFCYDKTKTAIANIQGGDGINKIPDSCEIRYLDGNCREVIMKATGKAAHISEPEKGKSAIDEAFMKIHPLLEKDDSLSPLVEFYTKYFICTKDGLKLNPKGSKHEMDKSTLCIGKISTKMFEASGQEISEVILEGSIRYPEPINPNKIISKLERRVTGIGGKLELYEVMEPISMGEESNLVRQLQRAYTYITKDSQSQPIAMSGSTYAKSCRNIVAFGPAMPGKEYGAHMPEEHILVSIPWHMQLMKPTNEV